MQEVTLGPADASTSTWPQKLDAFHWGIGYIGIPQKHVTISRRSLGSEWRTFHSRVIGLRAKPRRYTHRYCLGLLVVAATLVGAATMLAVWIMSSLGNLEAMYFSPPFSMPGCSPPPAGSGY
jgi:hypothetical protein